MLANSEFQMDHDRYVVMTVTGEGKPLSKLSPFAIHKGIAVDDVTIKCQFSGDIFLTCSLKNPNQIIYSIVFCSLTKYVKRSNQEVGTCEKQS